MNRIDEEWTSEWVSSGGGPLLVLPESLLPYWNGADAPESALIPSDANSITDYDRACGIHRLVDVISVGPSEGLVLADEPLDTLWWTRGRPGEVYLVRWVYGPSDQAVLKELPTFDTRTLRPTGLVFHLSGGPLVLFDSAMPGTDITTPSARTDLPAACYQVETAKFKPNAATELLVYRLTNDDRSVRQ
jgi:hypothetical protein